MIAFNPNDFVFNCTCVRDSPTRPEIYPLLANILPRRCDEGVYSYIVCDYSEPALNQFIVRFRINCGTKEASKQWLENFSSLGKTTYRISQTFPEDSDRVLYKVRLRCHHNTRPKVHKCKNHHKKHTGCPARITLTVKQRSALNTHGKMARSKDCHLPEHPMQVILHHTHNHLLNTAESLKYRQPSNFVCEKFMKLFNCGFNPSSALEIYRQSLFEDNEEQYYQMTTDRGILPNLSWVFRQYYKVFKKNYGENFCEEMLAKLLTFIAEYNNLHDGDFVCLERLDNDRDFIIVIVTPTMRRTMEFISDCADAIYIDWFGSGDKYGIKSLIFMTSSCSGPLPLCILIMTVKSEEAISKCLFIFQSLLTENSFCVRGLSGPSIIFVDDSSMTYNALKRCFPQSTLLISSYHVLRSAWKTITNPQSNILPIHRAHLYNSVKQMVFCKSEEELVGIYNGLMKNETVVGEYSKFKVFMQKMFARKNEWVYCYVCNIVPAFYDNICGKSIEVLKERILNQTKMFSADQLVHFVLEDLDTFYQKRLLELSNGAYLLSFKSRYLFSNDKLRMLTSRKLKDSTREVYNSVTNETYLVDSLIECCNCDAGVNGSFCKHIYFVCKKSVDEKIHIDLSFDERRLLYFISTGEPEFSIIEILPAVEEFMDKEVAKEVVISSEVQEEEEPEDIFAQVAFDREARWEDNFRSVQSEFRSVCADIENKSYLMKDVDMLSKFIENYRKFRTHQALSAACCSFGKFTNARMDGVKKPGEPLLVSRKRGRPRKRKAEDQDMGVEQAESVVDGTQYFAVADGTLIVPELNNIQQIFSVQMSDDVQEYITRDQLVTDALYLH